MYPDLKGKVALVTGSGLGIGRAIALALAGEGVDVAVNVSTRVNLAEQVVEEVMKKGRRSGVYQANIGDREAVRNMVEGVIRDFGQIDIMVNNAAVPPTLGYAIDQLDPDEWRSVMDTNVHGLFYCCHYAGKHMVARKSGNVINISSSAALRPVPLWGQHGVLKAAVITITRQLAMEWAGSNIRVNCIAPGLVETARTASFVADEELMAPRLRGIPMGRIGRPEEIASVALFLASEQSSFMTGQTLAVDGGETDYWPSMVDFVDALKRKFSRQS